MNGDPILLPLPGNIILRSIASSDCENLRQWKNAHRQFFFYKGIITPSDQQRWHAGYIGRPEDFMFVVNCDEISIGCMGIRLLDRSWDVYNVILGDPRFAGRGLMARAFQAMLGFAYQRRNTCIGLQVLKSNPAIGWYQRNGFRITADGDDHYVMQHFPS